MNKMDIKKLIILLVLIAAIVIVLVMLFKNNKKEKNNVNEEDAKIVETKTLNYLVELTAGYQSEYNGVDNLYYKDKTTVDDLTDASILATAIKYLGVNKMVTTDDALNNQIEREQRIDIDDYSVYSGEKIKEAVKELFGIDFNHKSVMNEENHIYTYWYLEEYDVYLVGFSPNYLDTYEYDYYVVPKVIETTKDNDNLKTEVAISYVNLDQNQNLKFSKEPNMSNIIYEEKLNSNMDNFQIADDKVNEFTHYIFTFKKVDNSYVFVSVEKK